MSGGRRKDAVLGDALEALIAAVYLDGGFEPAKALVLRLWASRITSVDDIARDAKSTLQEWAHARGMAPPIYTETGRDGPDHQPMFTVEVKLENGAGESARAGSKRVAEQVAARALLARLEQMND
jgi:ribonuclease-3